LRAIIKTKRGGRKKGGERNLANHQLKKGMLKYEEGGGGAREKGGTDFPNLQKGIQDGWRKGPT